MNATIENTYGALLLGSLVACILSGVVFVQVIVYYKLYPKDPKRLKIMVAGIWSLDGLHTCLVMASIWNYLIPHFGDVPRYDFIPWTIATTIAVTAITTITVHFFLAQRIYMLLQRSWRVTGPILILAVMRLGAAAFTTGEMIRLKSFSDYSHHFQWVFTLGLGLSSVVDVLITVTLCYNLRSSRTGTVGLNYVIDSLVLYTFETGALTTAAAILSMVFWIAMPHNRVFLSLHFIISKLYANSLLATLNMRITFRGGFGANTNMSNHSLAMFPGTFSTGRRVARRTSQFLGSDFSEVPSMLETREKTEIGVHEIAESDMGPARDDDRASP